MEYDQHIEAARRESEALVAAVRRAGPDASVPSCPEWTVGDLALHIGEFAGWWTHLVQDGKGEEKDEVPDPAAPQERADWIEGLLVRLHDVLAAAPPDLEMWSWTDDHSARFAARRVANELAIHRYDAELAAGTPSAIEGELAVDGIEEIFMMIPFRRPKEVDIDPPVTMHLHATDRDGEWLVAVVGNGIDVIREHAKGDLALRGAVSDLELTLYGRPTMGGVERFGDESVLDAWSQVFSF